MGKDQDKNLPTVLIIDDEFRALRPLLHRISKKLFQVVWMPEQQSAVELLKEQGDKVAVVIIDLKSSKIGVTGLLQNASDLAPSTPILVTAPLGPFLYHEGAFYEFVGSNLNKNINEILLDICELKNQRVMKDSLELKQDIRRQRNRFGSMIGCSPSMNRIYDLIEDLKDSLSTVLIYGESGTGKELLARTIHMTSPRKKGPFVAINCGAIPIHLIESELFGHERGAFTSAMNMRKGKFEVANGGTIFLDEIGEMDKDLQVKLLRVLQEKEFQRVGGNTTIKTNARIISATSRNLAEQVAEGHFREDIFFRLSVVPIRIPPLRERREDIPLLLEYFFEKISKDLGRPVPTLSSKALQLLKHYDYPGNVRELRNIVERILITCKQDHLTGEELPEDIFGYKKRDLHDSQDIFRDFPPRGITMKEVEKQLIIKTLEKADGNKAAAARMLGITRRLLYLRLAEFGMLGNKKCHRTLHNFLGM